MNTWVFLRKTIDSNLQHFTNRFKYYNLMEIKRSIKVLFVCMGNICRSPTAEGAFRKLVEEQGLASAIQIDSAGTHAYHVGEAPDRRAQAAAKNRDIDLSSLRGRQFDSSDFQDYDYVLVMDQSNFCNMQALDNGDGEARLSLFLDFSHKYPENEVPDPYYGGIRGFEHVLDLIQDACEGLLEHIRRHHKI